MPYLGASVRTGKICDNVRAEGYSGFQIKWKGISNAQLCIYRFFRIYFTSYTILQCVDLNTPHIGYELSSGVWLALGLNRLGIGTFGSFTSCGFGMGKLVRISFSTSLGLLTCANASKNGTALSHLSLWSRGSGIQMVRNGGNKHFYAYQKILWSLRYIMRCIAWKWIGTLIILKWTAIPIATSCQKLKKTTALTQTNLPKGRYGASSFVHAW